MKKTLEVTQMLLGAILIPVAFILEMIDEDLG